MSVIVPTWFSRWAEMVSRLHGLRKVYPCIMVDDHIGMLVDQHMLEFPDLLPDAPPQEGGGRQKCTDGKSETHLGANRRSGMGRCHRFTT